MQHTQVGNSPAEIHKVRTQVNKIGTRLRQQMRKHKSKVRRNSDSTRSSTGESGNVAILVGLMMVAFCGCAAVTLDVAGVYIEKQRAQTAADAGALAGANDLLHGATQAEQTGQSIATLNDPLPSYSVSADTTTDRVIVSATSTVPLWFSQIWGWHHATVHASSIAKLGSLQGLVGAVPIAVPQQTFTYGQTYSLSDGAGNGQSGNYGFLTLSDPGANDLGQLIQNGYSIPLNVGDVVSTQPGHPTQKVVNAIQYRIDEDAGDPDCNSFDTAKSDCPRVLYLPVVNTLDVSGRKDVTIVGFAAFYLDGLVGSGGHQSIQGRFIQMIHPGEIGTGSDFGVYGEVLTTQ